MSFDKLPTAKVLEGSDTPAIQIPAVAHCADIWNQVYRATLAKKRSDYAAECAAGLAYRKAMPPLFGFENISDFIACAVYGLVLGAIEPNQISRLMYSANSALAAARNLARAQPKTVKKEQNTPLPPVLSVSLTN